MEKKIMIEGMACGHCTNRVEQALNSIRGVHASVSLEDKCATVVLEHAVTDEELSKAVTDAGYSVISIS